MYMFVYFGTLKFCCCCCLITKDVTSFNIKPFLPLGILSMGLIPRIGITQ